jgi:hypothetical protein
MPKIPNPNSITPAKTGARNLIQLLDSRLRGCVIMQKIAYFLTVMPGLTRHPVV